MCALFDDLLNDCHAFRLVFMNMFLCFVFFILFIDCCIADCAICPYLVG